MVEIFFVPLGSVMIVAILWSVISGIVLMSRSGAIGKSRRRASRMLAWNLLEPGITAPWIIFNIVVLHKLPVLPRFATFPSLIKPAVLGIIDWAAPASQIPMTLLHYFWPMAVFLIALPVIELFGTSPENRLAGQRALLLGAARIRPCQNRLIITACEFCR